jgi:hypothetical protein
VCCLEGRIEIKILYEDCSKAPQKRAMILTTCVMMKIKTLRKNTNREETGQNRAEEKASIPTRKRKLKESESVRGGQCDRK